MPACYEFEGFRLDTTRRQLRDPRGRALDVPARAFDTLVFLVERRADIVSKEQIMRAVWPRSIVEENNLSQAISAVRRILGDARTEPRFVLTVPGRGYRFVAAVNEVIAGDTGASPLSVGYTSRPTGAPSQLDSIAVLPFRSLQPSPSGSALELGMADTLINEFSGLSNLRVCALQNVRQHASASHDPIVAGRALGAAAVLEGSIQTQDSRLRISARLLRVADGKALWVGRFDETLDDLFAIQDSIAARVIAELKPTLTPSSPHLLTRQTQNLQAYRHYIAGLYHQLRRDTDGLATAVTHYEAAIRADPGYVRAWAALSVSLAVQAVFGTQPPQAVFPRAKQAALHAMTLDPESPHALGALGHILVQYERKYVEGNEHYRRALERDGNNTQLHLWIAINEAHLGHMDRAIELIRQAIEIEPRTLALGAVFGMLLYYRRSFDEAIAHLQHLIDIEPRFDQARTFLGKAWLRKGDAHRALEQFEARANRAPGSFGDLGCAYAAAGRRAQAHGEIEKLRALSRAGYGVAYDLAAIHAALGDVPEACRSLRQAVDDHSQMIGFLRLDPALDLLQQDPSFSQLVARLYGTGGPD